VLEAGATFGVTYAVATAFGTSLLTSMLLASLAMSTSPAALVRVINEERSAGQVTERVLHLAAVNCVLSVFAFNVIVGFWTFQTTGSAWQAVSNSLLLLVASSALGGAFGIGMPALLRRCGRMAQGATLGFAIGVILLVAIAHAFKLSPVLAALTFGLVARHRRVTPDQAQRNFGTLGDLLTIVLFVVVATTISWERVWVGFGLALVLIAVRLATRVAVVGALAHVSGMSFRKGALTGLAMMPISVFVILLLEQTRHLGVDLIDLMAPLAAATLLLELAGPVLTQRALTLAGESADRPER
jgi:Kef-type K+ transport system membrane component KefB